MRYKEHVSKRWLPRASHRAPTHGNGFGTTSESSQNQEAADYQCPFPSRTRGFLALLLDNSGPHLQKSGEPLSSGTPEFPELGHQGPSPPQQVAETSGLVVAWLQGREGRTASRSAGHESLPVLNGPRHSSNSTHSRVSRQERKKDSEHPNPCHKVHGVPFMALLSVIASFTTGPSSKAWMVLQGHPRGSEP